MTGAVAWFTGLPSAGKSTLATAVARELAARGIHAVLLDSDDVRGLIEPPLGYDDAARTALYGTLGRLAALVASQGHVVLVPATAHRRAYRDAARRAAPAFVEIYVDTPLDECMRRDAKGTYKSRSGMVPGVDVDYEPPLTPELRAGDGAARIAERIADLAR